MTQTRPTSIGIPRSTDHQGSYVTRVCVHDLVVSFPSTAFEATVNLDQVLFWKAGLSSAMFTVNNTSCQFQTKQNGALKWHFLLFCYYYVVAIAIFIYSKNINYASASAQVSLIRLHYEIKMELKSTDLRPTQMAILILAKSCNDD